MLKSTIEKFEKMNVIDLYKQGYSLNQLERIIHSDKRTIRDFLLAKGIDVKITSDKKIIPTIEELTKSKSDLKFNSHKFDVIDTEEKAYWLGFLYADGYVSKDNDLSLGLQAQDVGHLHKFNRFLECQVNHVNYYPKITNEKVYDLYRFSVNNDTICKALIKCGCIPNKSLILTFPPDNVFSDSSLIKHFIRGYWDGDGCISPYSKQISVLGTYDFLTGIKNNIPSLNNCNIYLHANVYQIHLSRQKALSVIKYLYENANVYLDRKYKKYLEFCRLYEESYKLLEDENDELCDENIVLTE